LLLELGSSVRFSLSADCCIVCNNAVEVEIFLIKTTLCDNVFDKLLQNVDGKASAVGAFGFCNRDFCRWHSRSLVLKGVTAGSVVFLTRDGRR